MLKFDINYYDAKHESLLAKHKHKDRINKLISGGLTVEEEEFLIYAMFTQQSSNEGFTSYSDLKAKMPSRRDEILDFLDTSEGTVRLKSLNGQKHITERAGVAAALLIINEIFGLHEADWERIRETSRQRTMDFQIACNGTDFVSVEAKGRIFPGVHLTRRKELQEDIAKKKNAHPKSSSLINSLFGVITGIPYQKSASAECFLLDPIPESIYEDPSKYQLLARLQYYTRLITIISPGQIARALQNRIQVLRRASDYGEFDGLLLVDLYGNPIIPPPENVSPIWDKTVNKETMVGHVFPLSSKEFIYFAVDMNLFKLMINQDFNAIRSFVSFIGNDFVDDISLDAVLYINDLIQYGIEYDKFQIIKGTNKVRTTLHGNVHASNSGLILGFFALPE